jgi:hypothetical protein
MKRILIFSLFFLTLTIIFFLHNYHNPKVEASIKDNYKWMENVEVLQTDWYGSEGITFFLSEGFSNNEINLCKGYVSRNIIQTRTSWEGCVPLSNQGDEGVYGTSTFNGNPLISGFASADTKVRMKGEEVISFTYKNLQAWYAFYDKTSPEEPIFQ